MTGFRLYKKERLCSKIAIDALFLPGEGKRTVIAYPWRAVWKVNERREVSCAQFLISVPKKRLRHAVDRVAMRRRCREAYRLNRSLMGECPKVDVAFVYIGAGLADYSATSRAVCKILTKIGASLKKAGS
ncbi:MAG: ribonuclease P protein component [Paramuribaculum sp.]|nr:ribonuclease P protein component [Paramuribaculum sp.]